MPPPSARSPRPTRAPHPPQVGRVRVRISGEARTPSGVRVGASKDPNGNLTKINGGAFGTYDAKEPDGDVRTRLDALVHQQRRFSGQDEHLAGVPVRLRPLVEPPVRPAHGAGAASVDYLIDGVNRRIGRAVTSWSDRDGRPPLRRTGSRRRGAGRVEQRALDLRLRAQGQRARLHGAGRRDVPVVSDWRGDVRLVLNTTKTGSAAVVQQIDYDEWGNVTNLVDPELHGWRDSVVLAAVGFAGGAVDVTTGIVRFGARDYDPMMRRWTQKDPIRFEGGNRTSTCTRAMIRFNRSDSSGRGRARTSGTRSRDNR